MVIRKNSNSGINVLSLFDGMSGGQIALKELGIIPDVYYASEIDKHAIKQTQLNFPDTVQLGDVVLLRNAMCWSGRTYDKALKSEWIREKTKKKLTKLRSIDWSSINLLFAGSPCQGFSFAGKQLAFKDSRSKLFFVFVDILNHLRNLNPDVLFLLENVNMAKKHLEVITKHVGVYPVRINSNLVSAQNRDRWYWTNIRTRREGLFGELHSDIPQPEDKGIFLKDILEKEVDEKYYLSEKIINGFLNKKSDWAKTFNPINDTGVKAKTINSRLSKMGMQDNYISINGKAPTQRCSTGRSLDAKHNYQFIKLDTKGNIKSNQGKASCITGAGGHGAGNHSDMDLICVAQRGRNPDNPKSRKAGLTTVQMLETNLSGKSNTISTVQKDNLILQRPRGNNQGGIFEGKSPTVSHSAWEQNNILVTNNYLQLNGGFDSDNRFWYEDSKHATVVTRGLDKTGVVKNGRIRRLTPTEVARLQTVPDWYKWECSDTQIYKMCGNGWTIKVIRHILSFIK